MCRCPLVPLQGGGLQHRHASVSASQETAQAKREYRTCRPSGRGRSTISTRTRSTEEDKKLSVKVHKFLCARACVQAPKCGVRLCACASASQDKRQGDEHVCRFYYFCPPEGRRGEKLPSSFLNPTHRTPFTLSTPSYLSLPPPVPSCIPSYPPSSSLSSSPIMSSKRPRPSDGFKRGTGVDYTKVSNRHVDDDRHERPQAGMTKNPSTGVSNGVGGGGSAPRQPGQANGAGSSAAMDSVMRLMTGQQERGIRDKLNDSNRPTWDQYKKDNKDKLDLAGEDKR